MVNIDMREYAYYRQSAPPGAHFPWAAQSARRSGLPNTLESSTFQNSLCKQIQDAKHAFLIAWLIARNKRTNFDLSGLDSARSAFLIAPKSSNFSPYKFSGKNSSEIVFQLPRWGARAQICLILQSTTIPASAYPLDLLDCCANLAARSRVGEPGPDHKSV